ncbi:Protein of unknown function [Bacillus wiedmannii]|nr:Protein of unknown function [Bacillus wiedmannii]
MAIGFYPFANSISSWFW